MTNPLRDTYIQVSGRKCKIVNVLVYSQAIVSFMLLQEVMWCINEHIWTCGVVKVKRGAVANLVPFTGNADRGGLDHDASVRDFRGRARHFTHVQARQQHHHPLPHHTLSYLTSRSPAHTIWWARSHERQRSALSPKHPTTAPMCRRRPALQKS